MHAETTRARRRPALWMESMQQVLTRLDSERRLGSGFNGVSCRHSFRLYSAWADSTSERNELVESAALFP